MKYICKDCGKEYTREVSYCICGNNSFDIVEVSVDISEVTEETTYKKPIDRGLFLSWAIFVTCLILSIIVVFIPVNSRSNITQNSTSKISVSKEQIPDIDTFWKSTPPNTAVSKETTDLKSDKNIIKRAMDFEEPAFVKDLFNKGKTGSTVKSSSTQQKPQNVKKVSQAPKPASNFKPSTNSNMQTPKSNETKQNLIEPKQNPNSNKNKQEKPAQTVNKPVSDSVVGKQPSPIQEFNIKATANYESSLLRQLYSKFVVGGLSGNGSCVVSFYVDSNGKLSDRKFEKLSDNKPLNDAVYYMMMSTSTYTPPPNGYYKRTLKVQVTYKNGEYSIGYI